MIERKGFIPEPQVHLNEDQDQRDDHDKHGFHGVADIFKVALEYLSLRTERYSEIVLEQPQFQDMGLDLVFYAFDSFLIGCHAKDKKHKDPGYQGKNDHSYPGTHPAKRKKYPFDKFSEKDIDYGHVRPGVKSGNISQPF